MMRRFVFSSVEVRMVSNSFEIFSTASKRVETGSVAVFVAFEVCAGIGKLAYAKLSKAVAGSFGGALRMFLGRSEIGGEIKTSLYRR